MVFAREARSLQSHPGKTLIPDRSTTHTHTHRCHACVDIEQQQHTITGPQSRLQHAHCTLSRHKQESLLSIKVLHTQEPFCAPEISKEVCRLF